MKEITKLIEVIDHLLGPNGCPWDREQTLKSVRKCIVEEAFELVEAIDFEESDHIKEELGDYFFHAIFLSRLGEKEGRFNMEEVVRGITEKMILRHPHIFGDVKIETAEQVVSQWEAIKKKEKRGEARKSAMDGIPKDLPALSKGAKMARAMKKAKQTPARTIAVEFKDESSLGELLFQIVLAAEELGLDSEHALRLALVQKEKSFRESESRF